MKEEHCPELEQERGKSKKHIRTVKGRKNAIETMKEGRNEDNTEPMKSPN